MICTRYAQPLVGTLFCRVALGQSSLMGRWVHSPNQCYNFILLSAMKWNDLLFGSSFQMISYRNDTLIFDMIMINLSKMIVWPSFGAVSIRRKQDRNGTGDRVGGAVRQGIPGLQETKTGETAGKIAETAHRWAMSCRAMTSLFYMTNDIHI